jgi:ATP:corrinoid adenosyltransferase
MQRKKALFIDIIRTFSCLARKASSPVACVPFKNLTIATCNSWPNARHTIPSAEEDLPLPLPVKQAEQYLKDKAINLVVLDELTYMINYKYLDEQVILNTLNARPKNQHVVITGG